MVVQYREIEVRYRTVGGYPKWKCQVNLEQTNKQASKQTESGNQSGGSKKVVVHAAYRTSRKINLNVGKYR